MEGRKTCLWERLSHREKPSLGQECLSVRIDEQQRSEPRPECRVGTIGPCKPKYIEKEKAAGPESRRNGQRVYCLLLFVPLGHHNILRPSSTCRPLINAAVAPCDPNVPPGDPWYNALPKLES